MRVRALALAAVLGASASAWAQQVVHKEGEYTGVTPGKKVEAGKRVGKGTLSWVGFAAKDGGAEVFFQSATKFEVEQAVEGSTLVVKLSGLTRQVTNTRRPIDTRFFDNPLARITAQPGKRARRGKRGIDVRIVFKNPKDARAGTLRTATEADGLFYAYLSFPEGADSATVPLEDAGTAARAAPDLEGPDDDEAPVTSPDARPKAKTKLKAN